MNTVKAVCNGSLRWDNDVLAEAHSTVTFIQGDAFKIIVDTSDCGNRQQVLDGLERLGVDRKAVDVVINTHLHPDHTANNDLFPTATPMAHRIERPPMTFRRIGGDIEVHPGVRIMHTPGHTPGHVSVVVDTEEGTCVIAGDAIPTKENYDKMTPPRECFDTEMAIESMGRIIEIADIIIPGHGAPFKVERKKA
jgi:N-acyl homoserine lactone hydrolase